MIESLLGTSIGTLTAELNGQQWPVMPAIFTWIYQQVSYIMIRDVSRQSSRRRLNFLSKR